MAGTKITDSKAAPVAAKPGSLSAEVAYAAAASATNVAGKPTKAAPAAKKTEAAPVAAKSKATAKPAVAKKTAAKKPAAKKTVRKKTAKPIVKKTVTKGTKKMATKKTTATKRVAKNTKSANTKAANKAKKFADKLGARFEDLTGTAQERAKEAADRGVEIAKGAVEFNRENMEALIESGKITAKEAQELGKTNVKYTRENFVETSRALQGLFSVATPKDFFEKQTDYVRSGLDRVMDQTSNNADAVVKIAGKAYQPIADRLAVIQKELKKAA